MNGLKDGKVKIVLLGSIPKGDEARENFADWKTEYIKKINQAIPGADFLYGDLISDKFGLEAVVGHDLWLIKRAGVVIVNASTKVGAGTAQEMVIAKKFGKPVISVIPKDTHHRRSNVKFGGENIEDWIHPFLYISSDYVAESIDAAVIWLKNYFRNPTTPKDISIFDKAIENFEKNFPEMVNKYKK